MSVMVSDGFFDEAMLEIIELDSLSGLLLHGGEQEPIQLGMFSFDPSSQLAPVDFNLALFRNQDRRQHQSACRYQWQCQPRNETALPLQENDYQAQDRSERPSRTQCAPPTQTALPERRAIKQCPQGWIDGYHVAHIIPRMCRLSRPEIMQSSPFA